MSVKIVMGEEKLVFSPPINEETKKWGVYAIPRMWRNIDGRLIIRFNGEIDCGDTDNMQVVPNLYYASDDNGDTWYFVEDGESEFDIGILNGIDNPYIETEESIIAFREKKNLNAIEGVKAQKEFLYPTKEAIMKSYRYGDIPDTSKGFEILKYANKDSEPKIYPVKIDFPEREILVNTKGNTEAGFVDVEERMKQCIFKNPYFGSVIKLADGSLGAYAYGQHPDVSDHYCGVAYLLASEDGGHTWKKRGIIAKSVDLPYGYTGDGQEASIDMTPNGIIICAMRMDLCTDVEPFGTAVCISEDNGYTWSKPEIISDESVTPHVVALDNGVVVVVYGRPGVHFKISEDNGKTWSGPYSIIGKTLKECRAEGLKDFDAKFGNSISYSNTFVDKISEDTFIVLYNNLKYVDDDGLCHKAAFVRKIKIKKNNS